MAVFVDNLSDYIASIQMEGRLPFSAPFHWVILSNGLAKHDDSVIFFGFENKAPNPVLVVKVPRLPENAWSLQIEYDRLVELWGLLGDEAVYRLSQPIAMVNLEGQPALITTYLRGKNWLHGARSKLWDDPEQILALAVDVAQSLRDIMDRTATPLKANEKVPSDFQKKAEKFQQMYLLSSYEKRVVADLLKDVESACRNANCRVLVQGDFWHGNMIRSEEHGKLMFIDWQYSRWSTDVSLDVYLFLLAGCRASVSGESDQEKARKAAEVLSTWKDKIIPAYLTAFGKPDGYVLLPMRSGMLMCCIEMATRLSIDLGADQPEDIVWRYLFKELSDWQNENG